MSGGPVDWLGFYAQICADTGWDFDQVGRLTLPRYRALYAHFRRQPPVHWLLAAFIGWKPSQDGPQRDMEIGDVFDLLPPAQPGQPRALTSAMLEMMML